MEAHASSEKSDITLKHFLELAELIQYYGIIKEVLKVNKTSQLKYVANTDLHQIGLSRPEIRRYRKIYGKYFPNPYMNKIKKLLIPKSKPEIVPLNPSPSPTEPQPFTESNVIAPTKHIISIEDITINKELGMGQFGVVQQGTWNTGKQRLQVAIKCLGHERMTSNSTEFLKEAAVMHSIEHPNVVRLYGVVLHLDNLMLVTELAPLRSLLECLREVSLRPNFPVPTLCEFAEQICDGMTYLEQKRLIHRDLAARNILVFTKDKVKISDFGLSRALGVGKDYYQTNYNVNLKLPVAWCAPECILYLRFTSASDVWAFGVCLWEMFTYGFQPWAAFSGQQILEAIDAPNCQRLECPECCPSSYYTAMMHCWEHDAADRPRFKDLCLMLRKLRPEQVQATSNYVQGEDCRRGNFLEYKAGQIITVLNKECMNTGMWYGVLPGGTCGVFDPSRTKPYVRQEPFPKLRHNAPSALSALPSRDSARSCRSTRPILSRCDVKRHTYQGKRTLQRSMISSPQGDVQHTGHVGLDGAYFGDISFLDPAGCPPHQAVSPYKPTDDMEIPLLNSPSHTKAGRCKPPYPRNLNPDFLEIYLPYRGPLPMRSAYMRSDTDDEDEEEAPPEVDTKSKPTKKISKNLDPTTSKSIINKVKTATSLGRSRSEEGAACLDSDIHEYHEISDTDTESPTNGNNYGALELPDSPVVRKGNTDFSESLLKEVDSVFWSYVNRGLDRGTRQIEYDHNARSMTLDKSDKKNDDMGSMKPMSAHDIKTLDTAVALANEITSKSMSDLDTEIKASKFSTVRGLRNLKFTSVSLHHDQGKPERRNFSEEAKNVRDIQATLSEESKRAYMSLIEEPTPSVSLLSQISDECASVSAKSHPKPKPTSMPTPISPCTPTPTSLVLTSLTTLTTPTTPVLTSLTTPTTPVLTSLTTLTTPTTSPTSPPLSPPPARPSQPHPKRLIMKPTNKQRLPTPESSEDENNNKDNEQLVNQLPLPPRANKPKLVDKPRHIRKYPLKMPAARVVNAKELRYEEAAQSPIIYQNAVPASKKSAGEDSTRMDVDECDGTSSSDTNPFLNPMPGPSRANPFERYQQADESVPTDYSSSEPSGEPHSDEEPRGEDLQGDEELRSEVEPQAEGPEGDHQPRGEDEQNTEEPQGELVSHINEGVLSEESSPAERARALAEEDNTERGIDEIELDDKDSSQVNRDHVSVEDLMDFAGLRPHGRQRGAESDEVRLMGRVLQREFQVDPEDCLYALNLTNWNVYRAIQVMRVKLSLGKHVQVSLDDCSRELAYQAGDISKTIAILSCNLIRE